MNTLAFITDQTSLPIDFDMPLLLDACQAIGLTPEVCAWDDPTVDWSRFDAVLLRSPWSYLDRLPEFLAWCEAVDASRRLFNPVSVAPWSLDKLYLADLAARGVAVVPTRFVEPDANPVPAVREFLAEHPQAKAIVVKPTVGAYSKDVQRFARPLEEAAASTSTDCSKRFPSDAAPYFESVDRDGETDLIYFDEVYSHAIRKSAMLMPDGTVNVPTQESRKARTASLTLHSDPDSYTYSPTFKSLPAYSAAKSAMNSWTVHLSYELRDTPIKVNSAHPGYSKTDMNDGAGDLAPADGAATSVSLALLDDDGPTGSYVHAGKVLPW